ncbi:MAG: hypothetical protein KIT25_10005 [Enhydrobacter sp.]|nr:MAG: hypothetical protein KIT25_10005 [Enhydrobacter sp.]
MAALFALHLMFALGLLWFHRELTPDIYAMVLDENVSRTFDEVALGIGLGLLPLFWVPWRLSHPSEVFAYLLFLAVYLPFCTVGLQSIAVPSATLLPYIVLCGLTIISLFMLAKVPSRPIVRRGLSINQLALGVALLSGGIIVLSAATIGFDLAPRALEDVYDLRLIRREQFAAGGFVLVVLGYLLSPMNLVLGPTLVRIGLTSGRLYLLLVGAVVTYLSYQITGQKDALGACFIVIVATFAWGGTRDGQFAFATWRIVAMFLGFLVIAPIYDAWQDDPGRQLSQLTVSRLFIIPGMLGAYWVEFFSLNPHGYYAGGGALGLLFGRDEVYGIPLSRMIGLVYGGNEESNANVNMFAEGYAQAGLLGVVVASVVAIVAFRIVDRVTLDRDSKLVLPLCVPLAFNVTNGHIFGLILTAGLWLFVVLIYFMPAQRDVR